MSCWIRILCCSYLIPVLIWSIVSCRLTFGQDATATRLEPQNAIKSLAVHPQLQVELFASEPMMQSPSNIDVDYLGRVWICEIVNYRGHNGKRPAGDRILVLVDSDRDGVADKGTTFYQGTDIDSPHGICVLGSPDPKVNRVIVSAKGKVHVLTDSDGDLVCDHSEILFSGISGEQHDHGIHAFLPGPDGKLYFNFGNEGKQLKDKDGRPIIDRAGNEISASRQPYQEGMVFRCNVDGSDVETLAWNFRNNWEITVDSFGTLWQSDNDDDGNKGVRINFVMEFGNYGYKDERTGAGWQTERTGWESEIPLRHWHLNDPGVVPNLLQTGAGSPTGISVYEGNLLPGQFHGQLIHCDAGPNVCRAYRVTQSGAGYQAEIEDILVDKADKWFRPSDVCVAPDGSLFVADWFDPGVGGHQMGDLERGRVFRVTPRGHQGYNIPSFDFSTAEGACLALANPNYATRFVAWQALHEMGQSAEPALQKRWSGDDPILRARALWVLGKIPNRGQHYVDLAIADPDPRIRIVGLRLARQLNLPLDPILSRMAQDKDVAVRRECAIALRGLSSSDAAKIWAGLASQYDGNDRWYLEALGIGAEGKWDACLSEMLKMVKDPIESDATRDIIWRSRAKQSAELLVKIIKHPGTTEEEKTRYFRALDFLDGTEKEQALQSLLLP